MHKPAPDDFVVSISQNIDESHSLFKVELKAINNQVPKLLQTFIANDMAVAIRDANVMAKTCRALKRYIPKPEEAR